MLLDREIRREMLGSSRSYCIHLVGKRGPVNAIATPPGLPWDDWLVSESVTDEDRNGQVV